MYHLPAFHVGDLANARTFGRLKSFNFSLVAYFVLEFYSNMLKYWTWHWLLLLGLVVLVLVLHCLLVYYLRTQCAAMKGSTSFSPKEKLAVAVTQQLKTCYFGILTLWDLGGKPSAWLPLKIFHHRSNFNVAQNSHRFHTLTPSISNSPHKCKPRIDGCRH